MKKRKRLDFSKLQGKDALQIAEVLSDDGKARLINAAGVLLPTKTHTKLTPSLSGLATTIALIAWLDANTEEGDYWSPR